MSGASFWPSQMASYARQDGERLARYCWQAGRAVPDRTVLSDCADQAWALEDERHLPGVPDDAQQHWRDAFIDGVRSCAAALQAIQRAAQEGGRVLARAWAKEHIRFYVDRGDTLHDLISGGMGCYCAQYRASIHARKVRIEQVGAERCDFTFSLEALFAEVGQDAAIRREQPADKPLQLAML